MPTPRTWPLLLLIGASCGATLAGAEKAAPTERPGWELVEENALADLPVGDHTVLPKGEFAVYDGFFSTAKKGRWLARDVSVQDDPAAGRVVVLSGRLNEDGSRDGGAFIWHGKNHQADGGGTTAESAVRWEYRTAFQPGNGFAGVSLSWPLLDRDWPLHGEIDIIEMYDGNRKDTGQTNIHLDSRKGSGAHDWFPKGERGKGLHYTGVDWSQWMDVACEWVPTRSIAVYCKRPAETRWRELCRETDARWIPADGKHRLTFQMEFMDQTMPFAQGPVAWKFSRFAVYRPAGTAAAEARAKAAAEAKAKAEAKAAALAEARAQAAAAAETTPTEAH